MNAIAVQQTAPTTLVKNAKLGTKSAITVTRTIIVIRMITYLYLDPKKSRCSIMSKTASIVPG